jgi:hypothetical protein
LRLLSDDPPELAVDDFGTSPYTEAIAALSLNAPTPFTIGVFGAWGEGKTTVVGERLRRALQRDDAELKAAYVYFDCWKYQDDPLRRQLIREAARQLEGQNLISRRDAEELTKDFYEGRSREETALSWLNWNLIALALLQAVLVVPVVVLLGLVVLDWLLPQVGQVPATIIAGVLVSVIASLASGLVSLKTVQVSSSALTAPEVFEERFAALAQKAAAGRLVVVIDNLDRTGEDRVLETLAAVKTFLDTRSAQVVFVVACDEEAVRRVLESRGHRMDDRNSATREDDPEIGRPDSGPLDPSDEFLRKFFNTRVTLSTHLETDFRAYTEKLLVQSGLQSAGQLVEVLSAATRRSPRRIKQLINVLVARLTVLAARTGAIPDAAQVAKVVIIEESWPRYAQALTVRPRLLASWTQIALGYGTSDQLKLEAGLAAFLRATAHVTVTDVLSILQDRRVETEAGLSDAAAFRDDLVTGNWEADLGRVTEETSAAYSEIAGNLLQQLRYSPSDHRSALGSVLDLAGHFNAFDGVAITGVGQLARDPNLRTQMVLLSPEKLVRYAASLEPTDLARQVLTELVDRIREEGSGATDEWRVEATAAIARESETLEWLRGLLADLSAATPLLSLPAAQMALHAAAPELVSNEAVDFATDRLGASAPEFEADYRELIDAVAPEAAPERRSRIWRLVAEQQTPQGDAWLCEMLHRTHFAEADLEAISQVATSDSLKRAQEAGMVRESSLVFARARAVLPVELLRSTVDAVNREGADLWTKLGEEDINATWDLISVAPDWVASLLGDVENASNVEALRSLLTFQGDISPLLVEAINADNWPLVRLAADVRSTESELIAPTAIDLLVDVAANGADHERSRAAVEILCQPSIWDIAGRSFLDRLEAISRGTDGSAVSWMLRIAITDPLRRVLGDQALRRLARLTASAHGLGSSDDLLTVAVAFAANTPDMDLGRSLIRILLRRLEHPTARRDQVLRQLLRLQMSRAEQDETLLVLQSVLQSKQPRLTPADVRPVLDALRDRRRTKAFAAVQKFTK